MYGLDILFDFYGWKCMFVENFQIFLGEKMHVGGIFFVNK